MPTRTETLPEPVNSGTFAASRCRPSRQPKPAARRHSGRMWISEVPTFTYPIPQPAELGQMPGGTRAVHAGLDVLTPERLLYERLPGESPRTFATFCVYRDQRPLLRSVRKVAAELQRNPTTVFEWSSRWQWVRRAAAWDAEVDRTARQAKLDEIADANRRHVRVAAEMLERAAGAMDKSARKLATSPHALAEWAQVAVKVERDALGIDQEQRAKTTAKDAPAEGGMSEEDREMAEIMSRMDPATRLMAQEVAFRIPPRRGIAEGRQVTTADTATGNLGR